MAMTGTRASPIDLTPDGSWPLVDEFALGASIMLSFGLAAKEMPLRTVPQGRFLFLPASLLLDKSSFHFCNRRLISVRSLIVDGQ